MQVEMRVDQARKQGPAVEIDQSVAQLGQRRHLPIGTGRQDRLTLDSQGSGIGKAWVKRVDPAVGE